MAAVMSVLLILTLVTAISFDASFSVAVSKKEIDDEKKVANGNFSNGYIESTCIYRKICKIIPDYNYIECIDNI